MAGVHSDSPPPYHALEEGFKTEDNHFQGTEVIMPPSHDDPDYAYGVLFEHKDNRIGFIQKVILIKLFQILLATIPLAVFASEPYEIYRMMEHNYNGHSNLLVVSSLLLLAVLGLIHYCDKARFARPYNYLFLLAYPLSFGFFVAVVTWRFGSGEILLSWMLFLITVFFMLVYSILALQSKIEFKTSIGISIAAGSFIVLYALTIPFIYVNAFGVLYCSLALFMLTAYILYDIRLMMSRNYRLHMSPSDFVKAAVIMHIDYRYMIMDIMLKNNTDDDADPVFNNAA
ncbi:hypothetical protein MSG28_004971 [Choristoneura fumiferana]|uniref:Uncharacterized protein n=1 Tax=Choristoneura fumiferana TaxID=7141 RepID=A0ACC0JPD5_CHOFU|nr:hypothetical protein MSG28_004971 [Choristoneura fumiferana]